LDAPAKKRKKGKKLKKWLIITALLLAVICVLSFFAFDNALTLTEYTFESERLPEGFDGFKILAICDLHSQEFGKDQSELIALVKSENPDLVVLLGDIIDSRKALFEPLEALLKGISSDYAVYAVLGNHEKALSYARQKKLEKMYESYGVTLLKGEGVVLYADKTAFSYEKIARLNGNTPLSPAKIEVYTGRTDEFMLLWGGDDPPVWNDGDLKYIAENGIGVSPMPEVFNIFLYHRANLFPEVYKYGFDLTLSAHLHGGQVRLPFVGGLISPTRRLFPKYTAGMHDKAIDSPLQGLPKDSTMIVGRGLGNTAKIPRVFNPPEVFTVTLKTER
jgi:predicted MPP superfamily phosphohydrolase